MYNKNPIKPFWSWNDKLDKELLCRQIENMKKAGINGFFMHARGGLKTEYMSDEWFDMIEACLDKADSMDMQAWAYDENGWPSGFADGIVPKMGEDYCQKWLVCEEYENTKNYENVVGYYTKSGNKWSLCDAKNSSIVIFYEVNKYYIDAFNKTAIKEFLNLTHQKYYERFSSRFGKSLKGFFTDEPQYGCNHTCPWSKYISEEFLKEYGYRPETLLPLLFFEDEGYQKFRVAFYNITASLFRESFIKQMYDWCGEHNCMLTGHMMGEESLSKQIRCTGGVMSCYEYFHEPGIDWLGRKITGPLIPKQLGSVAAQLGKKTLTESFALCGWDVSLNELKWIAEWQFVNGVTSVCPHLEGYTLQGLRKRDYPASFSQLPWYSKAYNEMSDYLGKLGGFLDSCSDYAPVLVLHGIQSAYIVYNPDNLDAVDKRSDRFDKIVTEISAKFIPHHYGDEIIINRYGSVQDNRINIGKCQYKAVVLPELINITANTLKLLYEFALNGGRIYAVGLKPSFCDGEKTQELEKLNEFITLLRDVDQLKNNVLDLCLVNEKENSNNFGLCIKNSDNEKQICYIVNYKPEQVFKTFEFDGDKNLKLLDIKNGNKTDLPCVYANGKTLCELSFAPYESRIIILENGKKEIIKKEEKQVNIKLKNEFEISKRSKNAITLDCCRYRIDRGPWQEKIAVIKLQDMLLALKKECFTELKFDFEIYEEFDFSSLELCMETPEIFDICINQKQFKFNDCGEFFDSSVRKCNISKYVKVGKNEILLSCKFYQKPKVYSVLFDKGVHECERNKLTLDTELESIYIVGDFAVDMIGEYSFGERRCIHSGQEFLLKKHNNAVDISKITQSGYWFFSGEMLLSQKIQLKKQENVQYFVSLKKLNSPAAKLYINRKPAGKFAFAPFKLNVTEFLKNGENLIEIELYSGNRNLLGPHHKPIGETHYVGPSTFSDKDGWTELPDQPRWTDNYNFVLFGAEL